MKALFIVGLLIANDACADFSLEMKCLKDERTGIILTYDDTKPIIVKNCKNPENAQLSYWRVRHPIPDAKGNKWISRCFVSAKSPMERLDIPTIPCDVAEDFVTDLWNKG